MQLGKKAPGWSVAATEYLWWAIEMTPLFWPFLAFFSCSGRFGKNGDFLAAQHAQQPPKRSFDRPVRWYLGYLRARDAQSATLPLVGVTSGGSNLPVRRNQLVIAKRGPEEMGL